MLKHRFMLAVVASLVILSIFSQGTLVLAGTTGALTGTITEKPTNAPIANAKVTVSSPSQNATTITDASGHFGFLSLAPDSYTISVEKTGFESFSQAGVTVQSDQSASLTLSTSRQLRTIGRTTARSSGSLVRSGVTSDVYSITPAQQAAAAPLGGGNNLNSAYSAIQAAPGVLVPISDTGGWGQSINIRGGDYTQTGNELDGIPINRGFDQYSGSPLSNLGNAEIQVYTGNQPVDAQASGLAGFVNQVIKSGTYPGFSTAQFGVGSPGYYHKLSFETGGATANRNFSYYLGFLGYNQENRFVDQYNGAGYTPLYGTTINYIAQGCGSLHPSVGCYANAASANLVGNLPIGPNGYVTAPTYWGAIPALADREGTANFHIGLPHPHDGQKDDIQLLYNTGETYNTPNASFGSFNGALGDVLSGNVTTPAGVIPSGACFDNNGVPIATGAPIACVGGARASYIDQNYYTGPLNGRLTQANLGSIRNSFFAGSNNSRAFGANVPLNQIDTETTGFAVTKVQYQHNFSSNAYARVYGYSFYSDRIDNGIQADYVPGPFAFGFSSDYLISSHTRGVAALFADQVDAHNLLNFDAAYTYSNTSRNRNDVTSGAPQSPVAYLVSSTNPTGGCYNGIAAAATRVKCGGASTYVLPALGGSQLVPGDPANDPTLAQAATQTCGGAPCQYLAVNTGATGAYNQVNPAFTNASISDSIKPNDKLTIAAALRFEDYTYNLPATNSLGNQLLTTDYNNSHCVAGTSVTSRALGTACLAGAAPTALNPVSPPREDYAHIFSPRLGLTYSVDPQTVLRASYGRFTQPAETSSVFANNFQAGAPSSAFYANFGFPSFARFVEPEISYNTDFSIEHAFPKADTQLKVSPFYRKTTNEFVSILVDPRTQFIANINGLNRDTSGVELAVTKGDFSRNGFSTQLAYTYTHATAKFKVFPNGGSFVATANTAIQQYNGYTSACAKNPKASNCGPTVFCATNPTSAGCTNGATGAAPCFSAATGAPVQTCVPGTVANPYWNSQTFGTLDPGASYIPFNNSLGVGTNGIATSYIVPHVASLILNYKRGPLTITPSFQFQGGSKYGSPLAVQGVAPDTCGILAGATLAGDPRYTSGSPGNGSPYNAASCTSLIAIPNPQTGHFDGIGEYTQPNLIATNLSVNYDFSKTVGINLIAANIFNRCFGGTKVPWSTGNLGCAYQQSGGEIQPYVANIYNPGDVIQPYASQSYLPNLGGALQSISAGSPLPFELYVNLNVKI